MLEERTYQGRILLDCFELNSHQPYRLLRFSIKLSAIYFHAIYDHGAIPKDPKVSTYLLTYE